MKKTVPRVHPRPSTPDDPALRGWEADVLRKRAAIEREQRRLRVSITDDEGRTVKVIRHAGDPRELKAALKTFLKADGLGEAMKQGEWREIWERVAGPEIAAETVSIGQRGGTLTVEISDAALLSELASFHKKALLSALRDAAPDRGLRDIRFVAGSRPPADGG